MYLVEEGILQWFRDQGLGPQALYHKHGLELEVLDSSVQLPALMEIDDIATVQVRPARATGAADQRNGRRNGRHDGDPRFDVRIELGGTTEPVLALRGKVTAALIRTPAATGPNNGRPSPLRLPAHLAPLVRAEVRAPDARPDTRALDGRALDGRALDGGSPEQALSDPESETFYWPWVARYFHCHYSDRVQHSAFVRALEEVVDRFLAARGMSIRTMLDSRGWIPVVSRARVRLVASAHMEETIHTTFTVSDILKERAFDATMHCYVERDGRLVQVATAQILHGYAMSRGPEAGSLVVLDRATQQALLDGRTP
jgi:acyl-CoA thioesterase FadM